MSSSTPFDETAYWAAITNGDFELANELAKKCGDTKRKLFQTIARGRKEVASKKITLGGTGQGSLTGPIERGIAETQDSEKKQAVSHEVLIKILIPIANRLYQIYSEKGSAEDEGFGTNSWFSKMKDKDRVCAKSLLGLACQIISGGRASVSRANKDKQCTVTVDQEIYDPETFAGMIKYLFPFQTGTNLEFPWEARGGGGYGRMREWMENADKKLERGNAGSTTKEMHEQAKQALKMLDEGELSKRDELEALSEYEEKKSLIAEQWAHWHNAMYYYKVALDEYRDDQIYAFNANLHEFIETVADENWEDSECTDNQKKGGVSTRLEAEALRQGQLMNQSFALFANGVTDKNAKRKSLMTHVMKIFDAAYKETDERLWDRFSSEETKSSGSKDAQIVNDKIVSPAISLLLMCLFMRNPVEVPWWSHGGKNRKTREEERGIWQKYVAAVDAWRTKNEDHSDDHQTYMIAVCIIPPLVSNLGKGALLKEMNKRLAKIGYPRVPAWLMYMNSGKNYKRAGPLAPSIARARRGATMFMEGRCTDGLAFSDTIIEDFYNEFETARQKYNKRENKKVGPREWGEYALKNDLPIHGASYCRIAIMIPDGGNGMTYGGWTAGNHTYIYDEDSGSEKITVEYTKTEPSKEKGFYREAEYVIPTIEAINAEFAAREAYWKVRVTEHGAKRVKNLGIGILTLNEESETEPLEDKHSAKDGVIHRGSDAQQQDAIWKERFCSKAVKKNPEKFLYQSKDFVALFSLAPVM